MQMRILHSDTAVDNVKQSPVTVPGRRRMPPKKSKDPAEPTSGEGAELSPSPEPEVVDSIGDAGVRQA